MTRTLVALVLLFAACGPATPEAEEPAGDPLAPRRLYPLAEGYVWSYDIDTGPGEPTLAITRVTAVIDARVEVSSGGDPIVYELRDEGIFQPATDTWLLKAPVREGAEWSAAGGRIARVTSTSETIEVPAGRFDGCVRVEEGGGDAGKLVTTVYCPDVGPVYLEVQQQLVTTEAPVRAVSRMLGYNLGGEI